MGLSNHTQLLRRLNIRPMCYELSSTDTECFPDEFNRVRRGLRRGEVVRVHRGTGVRGEETRRMVSDEAVGSVGVTYLWNYGTEVGGRRSERWEDKGNKKG